MYMYVYSFIHCGDLYSAPSRLLLRSAPDLCTAKKKSFEARVKCVRKNPGEQSLRQRKPIPHRGAKCSQPPRMHGPGLWRYMYEQREQRVTPVPMSGVNCDLWCPGWESKVSAYGYILSCSSGLSVVGFPRLSRRIV